MKQSETITDEVAQFWRQGYLVVRGAFARAEMDVMREVIVRHEGMQAHADRARERSTGNTRPSFETIYVWNDMFDPFHNAVNDYYLVRGDLKGSWEGLPKDVEEDE